MSKISLTILVSGPYPIYRAGLASILARFPEFRGVGEASEEEETLRLLEQLQPQLLVFHQTLESDHPAQFVAGCSQRRPHLRSIWLMDSSQSLGLGALRGSSVRGFLSKDEAPESILSAVGAVGMGRSWFSPVLLPLLAAAEDEKDDRLDEVEALVLNRLLAGRTLAAIAWN